MSRVGKKPLEIPSGVDLKIEDENIRVKGPKGELSLVKPPRVILKLEDNVLTVHVPNENAVKDKALWGLTRRLIGNMVEGVTEGYSKQLEVNGVGYKVALMGKDIKLNVGYSHDVNFPAPEGITFVVEKNVITVSGIDKQLVGETAAQIRKVRKPEPYKGKGIKYMDEVIIRKAGKTAKAGA